MSKLFPLVMAAALGAAMFMSIGAPYDLAAENLAINRTPAHEIHKQAAMHEAMQAAESQAPLPIDVAVVLPRDAREG
jgi:hypothetical protein